MAARTRAASDAALRPIEYTPPDANGEEPDEPVELDNVIPFGVFDAFTDGSR